MGPPVRFCLGTVPVSLRIPGCFCCWVVWPSPVQRLRCTSFHSRTAAAVRLTPTSRASSSVTHWVSRGPYHQLSELCWFPGSSHGVFSKTSLRRLHAKQSASTEVVSEVPTSNAARPCRFSRLRRLALLCACRLIASCCQPWDLPGFEPVVDIAASRQTRLAGTDPSELFPSLWPNHVTPTLLPGSPKPVPLSL